MDRFDRKTIAGRIFRAREAAGLSRKELYVLARIEKWAYYKKESGAAPFHLDELSRVCEALGAPRVFPFIDWDAALLVDRLLGPELQPRRPKP